LIKPAAAPAGAEKKLLGFDTLTLAPIDRRLIDPGLLSPDEFDWIDRYHERVRAALGPQLDARARAWLDAAVAPISNNKNNL
jgi:Xaa-Pro aminopeptidase